MAIYTTVALLAEGVDRNNLPQPPCCCTMVSPSSRRAWIEIDLPRWVQKPAGVALLAEGVDRNRLLDVI